MTGAYQQYANGQTGAGYGYKRLPAAESTATDAIPALLCAGIGVALGILVGTALGASSWLTNLPAASRGFVPANSSAAGLNIHLIANAAPAPSLQRQAENQGKEQPSSALKSIPGGASAANKVSAVYRQQAVRKVSARRRFSARRRAYFMRKASVFLKAPAHAALPPASEAARVDVAPEPFSFIIEGDVTVADYDASRGMIATREGKTFVIDRTAGEGDTAPWQDYRANLHYRCDQSRICTLFHAGVVVPNAKLSL